jgi:hypothetical protein
VDEIPGQSGEPGESPAPIEVAADRYHASGSRTLRGGLGAHQRVDAAVAAHQGGQGAAQDVAATDDQ